MNENENETNLPAEADSAAKVNAADSAAKVSAADSAAKVNAAGADAKGAAAEKKKKPPFHPVKFALDYVETFVYAAFIVVILFTFLTRLTTVIGPSMEDTFFEGELLIVSDFLYDPKPGDLIVFHELGRFKEPIIKRVIATEGQTVSMTITSKEWTLYVDGEPVDEPYRKLDPTLPLRGAMHDFPVTVPEGHIFVLGDNRNNSADSRVTYMGNGGFIDERKILGKVILRLTPLDRFGFVE